MNNHFQARFRQTSQNITSGPGERAVLKCKVENLGTKTVSTVESWDDLEFKNFFNVNFEYNMNLVKLSLYMHPLSHISDGESILVQF